MACLRSAWSVRLSSALGGTGDIMPDSFVVMWTIERSRWLQRVGDRGPLEVVFGGPHISMPSINAVQVEDTVYPVSIMSGALYIIAGLKVEELLSPEDFVRQRLGMVVPPAKTWGELFWEIKRSKPSIGHRIPTTCADLAATGSNGSEIRFDRQVPSPDLSSIRLGPKHGREQALKGVVKGRLMNNFSLQGHVRRLSSQSAALFAQLL